MCVWVQRRGACVRRRAVHRTIQVGGVRRVVGVVGVVVLRGVVLLASEMWIVTLRCLLVLRRLLIVRQLRLLRGRWRGGVRRKCSTVGGRGQRLRRCRRVGSDLHLGAGLDRRVERRRHRVRRMEGLERIHGNLVRRCAVKMRLTRSA
jgi:hypothetical protein